MIKTTILIIFVLLSSHLAHVKGQNIEPNNAYSEPELLGFVKIYLFEPQISISIEDSVRVLLKRHRISESQYQSRLLESLSYGSKLDLSTDEQAFLLSVKKIDEQVKKEQQQARMAMARDLGIPYQRYLRIKKQYETDPKFQQLLIPYISKYTDHGNQ